MVTTSEASLSGPAEVVVDEPPAAPGATARLVDQRDLPYRVVSANVRLGQRLREMWTSRELFVFLVRKELKVKYKSSFLGMLWSMLNPATTLAVYYGVFKYIAKNPTPDFALYLFSGLLVWNLIATVLPGATTTIVSNAGIVKKVAFPREILPLSMVGTGVVYLFLQTIVMAIFLIGFHYSPDWAYTPVYLFGIIDLIVIASALGIFLSAIEVYYRDVEHLVLVVLTAWFWAVAIVYNYNTIWQQAVTHHIRWLLIAYLADPIEPIILGFQRFFYGRVTVAVSGTQLQVLAGYPYHFYVEALTGVLVGGILLAIGAMKVFGRIEGNFAEEL
jgi:ABC-2 type transport system permease protein